MADLPIKKISELPAIVTIAPTTDQLVVEQGGSGKSLTIDALRQHIEGSNNTFSGTNTFNGSATINGALAINDGLGGSTGLKIPLKDVANTFTAEQSATGFNFNGGSSFVSGSGQIFSDSSWGCLIGARGTETTASFGVVSTAGTTVLRVPNTGIYANTISASFRVTRISSTNVLGSDGSSIRYKKDVEDLDVDFIEKLFYGMKERYFKMKDNSGFNPDWGYIGYIAEELAEVAPELCTWGYLPEDYEIIEYEEEENGEKVKKIKQELKKDAVLIPDGVQYDRLGVVALAILRKQEAKIKAQDEQITSLEKRLQALEKKLK